MKRNYVIGVVVVMVMALALAGCDSEPPAPAYDGEYTVTAATFLTTIRGIVTSGKYLITLTEDVPNTDGVTLQTAGADITVDGGGHSINWNRLGADHFFDVRAGKLTLQNVTLGRVINEHTGYNIVTVRDGATLVLGTDATLSNRHAAGVSEGVKIIGTGTFILSGGTIEDVEKGVFFDGAGGKFTMENGAIKAVTNGIVIDNNPLAIVTIYNGTISDSFTGIRVRGSSSGAKLTITGGAINSTQNEAIVFGGTGTSLVISGAATTITGFTDGVKIEDTDHTVAISGGVIKGTQAAINIVGSDQNVTISGVTISDAAFGIKIYGTDQTVAISGNISGTDEAINAGANGAEITLTNATLSSTGWAGANFCGTDIILSITGGRITGGVGFSIEGSDNVITIISGQVTGTGSDPYPGPGIFLRGNDNTLNIRGGTITSDEGDGVAVVSGSGHIVSQTGGSVSSHYVDEANASGTFNWL